MPLRYPLCPLLLLTLSAHLLPAQTVTIANWQGNKAGAVSLTFDDGSAVYWSAAGPEMAARGIRGTFFLITDTTDWASARAAAGQGHEIASHSTDGQKLVNPDYTLKANAETLIQTAKSTIEAQIGLAVPGYVCVSFAYPFGITSLESDGSNLPDLVSHYHAAARTAGGNIADNHPDPLEWAYRWAGAWRFGKNGDPRPDLANYWISRSLDMGPSTTAATVANLLDTYAIGMNRWSVLMYHPEDIATTFTAQLDEIASRASQIWIAPFGEVARYVRQRAATTATVESNDGTTITVSLADGLDDTTYNVTLTLLVDAPAGWTSAEGSQAGNPIPVSITGGKLVFDAVPDAGLITLVKVGAIEPAVPVVDILPLGPDSVQLGWASESGVSYEVKSGADLSTIQSFEPPELVPGTGGRIEHTVPFSAGKRFYQVEAIAAP